ncbi:nucleotide-binding universal stress UspA family protein [Paenarthrobacter sp. TE4293]
MPLGWAPNSLFFGSPRRNNKGMAAENFSGPIPLVVGVLPDQHVEVLQTARTLAERLGVPLVCAYVDEASYLVEWDPSRETHRMSLHPEKDDADVEAVRGGLGRTIAEAMDGGSAEWTLRLLAGDPARALGRLAADINASMIIVGTPEPGLGHRISEALNGSVAAWLSHHQRRPVLIVPQEKRPEAAHKN